MGTSCIVALFVLSCASLLLARPSYRERIPNGNKVPDPCNPGRVWRAIGHWDKDHGGLNSLNTFGKHFAAAGLKWTRSLCLNDSDGDGFSNGFELGDPNCTWVDATSKAFYFNVTQNPAVCEPIDSTWCQMVNGFNVTNCPELGRLLELQRYANFTAEHKTKDLTPTMAPVVDNNFVSNTSGGMSGWNQVQPGCVCYCFDESSASSNVVDSNANSNWGTWAPCMGSSPWSPWDNTWNNSGIINYDNLTWSNSWSPWSNNYSYDGNQIFNWSNLTSGWNSWPSWNTSSIYDNSSWSTWAPWSNTSWNWSPWSNYSGSDSGYGNVPFVNVSSWNPWSGNWSIWGNNSNSNNDQNGGVLLPSWSPWSNNLTGGWNYSNINSFNNWTWTPWSNSSWNPLTDVTNITINSDSSVSFVNTSAYGNWSSASGWNVWPRNNFTYNNQPFYNLTNLTKSWYPWFSNSSINSSMPMLNFSVAVNWNNSSKPWFNNVWNVTMSNVTKVFGQPWNNTSIWNVTRGSGQPWNNASIWNVTKGFGQPWNQSSNFSKGGQSMNPFVGNWTIYRNVSYGNSSTQGRRNDSRSLGKRDTWNSASMKAAGRGSALLPQSANPPSLRKRRSETTNLDDRDKYNIQHKCICACPKT